MQHLPQLALLAIRSQTDAIKREQYIQEIQDQTLDFIAHNPPQFGVNWRVPMDIGIRAANWCLAVRLLSSSDIDLPDTFLRCLQASLRDHGRAIIDDLEWNPHVRGNHYLANICGLLFIATTLPRDKQSDTWLAFASSELITEGLRQIHPDGSGIEASTSYHRLSVEMITHATALLLGLPQVRLNALRSMSTDALPLPRGLHPKPLPAKDLPLLPANFVERLARARHFTATITRPDGRAVLIGDNDSGRFFDLCPDLEWLSSEEAGSQYQDWQGRPDGEEQLARRIGERHQHLLDALDALFSQPNNIHGSVIHALSGGQLLKSSPIEIIKPISTGSHPSPAENAKQLLIPLHDINLSSGLELQSYPGWGLYVLRNKRLLLSFRCGPLGLEQTGNHDHNDQLAITLTIDDKDLIGDPGSYRYTADIRERDAYRSVHAHFAPQTRDINQEPGSLANGPWQLGNEAQAQLESANTQSLQGRHTGYGIAVHRRIDILKDAIQITDWADGALDLIPPEELFNKLNSDGCLIPYCPDYGLRHA